MSLTPKEAGHVVCPSLQELHLIYTEIASEKLLNMAEQRDERGFRLRKLQVYSVAPPKQVARIQQHVDEVSIIMQGLDLPIPQMCIPRRFSEYRHDRWREIPGFMFE
jgi:hypothetical protein